MSDFLSDLVERSFAAAPRVRPQQPSFFESRPTSPEMSWPGPEFPESPAAEQDLHQPPDRILRLQSLGPNTNGDAAAPFKPGPARPGPTPTESVELPGASTQPGPVSPPVRSLPDTARPERRREMGDIAEEIDALGPASSGPTLTAKPIPDLASEQPNIPAPQEPEASVPASKVDRNNGSQAPFPSRPLRAASSSVSRESRAPRPPEEQTDPGSPARPPARAVRAIASGLRPSKMTAPAPENSSLPPSINVTIGRVEVRATLASTPSKAPGSSAAVLSLEEYLRRRAKGDRR